MKKTLSILLLAGVWGYTQGQNTSTSAQPAFRTISMRQLMKARMHTNDAVTPVHPLTGTLKKSHKLSGEPMLPHLGSSFNPNSVRDASTTATTANQNTGLIVMTHRDDSSKFVACNDGAYEAAYSTNGGATWDTNVYIGCNVPTRYPNGVIFNPAGNTNPMNCTVAMAGPYTNSSTTTVSWVETAFGSVQISGANPHESLWANSTPGVLTEDNGDLSYMSSSDDSTVHVMGEGWTVSGTDLITWKGAVLTTGKFNAAADSFQWTQTLFRPHLVPDYKGFTTSSVYDSMAYPWGTPGTAWSQDGKTGYVVIFGNMDSVGYNYASNQPIVYKTTNSGATWTMMPLFNFRNLSTLTQYLYPSSDSSVAEPLWNLEGSTQGDEDDYDLTVDVNGNLHIFGAVISAYYTNPDSAYETEYYNPGTFDQKGKIYDVYTTTNTGGWQARFIDSLRNYPVVDDEYNSDWQYDANGGIPVGARIQASRTADGRHVFCTWVDDTTGTEPDSLTSPDIFGQAYNVVTGQASKKIYQFTTTSNNYFTCVSDIALVSADPDTTYTIPVTIAYPQSAPNVPGDAMSPINYFYVGSVQYNDSLQNVSAIPTIAKSGFSIGPNYPNPFTNITQFNISLTNESTVAVDVFNLVGEKVYSIGAQKMSSGNHIMTINGSGLSAGVYFYRVTANGESKTQKMVIE